MKLLGTRVAIEPQKVESKSESGIVLAVTEAKTSNRGTVKAIGTEVDEVAVGELVQFSGAHKPVEMPDGTEYYIMDIDKVEAVIG